MANASVLIVEKESAAAIDLHNMLQPFGFTLLEPALTAASATERARQQHPDIALIEIDTEGTMRGVELGRHLHEQLDLPVIFLTSRIDEPFLARIRQAEPWGVLLKPLRPDELQAAMWVALDKHEAEKRQRERLTQFQAVFTDLSEGVFIFDSEGDVVQINPAALRLSGFIRPPDHRLSVAELERLGHPTFLDGQPVQPQDCPLLRAVHGESFTGIEIRIQPNGSVAPWIGSFNGYPLRDEEGKLLLAIVTVRDISAFKQSEHALVESNERLKVLSDAALRLLVADQPEEFLRSLFERIAEQLELDVYLHYQFAEDGRSLRLASSKGLPPASMEDLAQLPLDQYFVKSLDQPCIPHPVEPALAEDPLNRLMASLGVQVYAYCQLVAREHMSGVLCVGSREKASFTPEEMAFIHTICAQISLAIESNRMIAALEQRASELTEADRHKDEFLAMLAHELRNPLSPIMNTLEVMRLRSHINVSQESSIERMERQVRHLSRLVDDLLDISRIAYGQIKLHKERLDVKVILNQAVEEVRPFVESRKHELTLSMPFEPIWLEADATRLQQMVVNLLNNAVKYTESGGRIWLTLEREGTSAVIRVRDTGIGIPPEDQPNIFKPFMQASRSIDRALGGMGIGLNLVKRLAQMHGGDVSFYSPGINMGSEFTLHLPIYHGASLEKPVSGAGPHGGASHRMSILVVEDSEDSAKSLGELLELWGYEVHLTFDGPSAISAALKYCPDVLLLDIGLPGLDGYHVAETLRRKARFESALIIAITGYGQAEDKKRSREAGIDYHLMKPVDLSELKALLERHGYFQPQQV